MKRNVKYIIAVADGMADEPLAALGGRTPIQAARTPCMDLLAQSAFVGLLRTVPPGMPPGSDVANLSLFGYPPAECYTGRAPLEAASMGIELGPEDLAFRCNLVRLRKTHDQEIMADYSGGGLATSLAGQCIQVLNERLRDARISFHPGVSYRHVLLWKEARRPFDGLQTTPPHDITDQAVEPFLPLGPGSHEVRMLMGRAREVLASCLPPSIAARLEGKTNSIWLWGQGPAPRMSTLVERFGIRGATVCAVDLIKGLGRCAGLEAIEVAGATGDLDTNYRGKASAVLKALENLDFVFLHVEAPDEASHRGDLQAKIEAIEHFDADVLAPLCDGLNASGNPYRILLCPDHPTPLRTRTHSKEPVPFLLFSHPAVLAPNGLAMGPLLCPSTFDEDSAASTGLFIEQGHRILDLLLEGTGS